MLQTICTSANTVGVAGIGNPNGAPFSIQVEAIGSAGSISGNIAFSNTGNFWTAPVSFEVTPTDATATLFTQTVPYAFAKISIAAISGGATLHAVLVN